jgi:hypothetical protein
MLLVLHINRPDAPHHLYAEQYAELPCIVGDFVKVRNTKWPSLNTLSAFLMGFLSDISETSKSAPYHLRIDPF